MIKKFIAVLLFIGIISGCSSVSPGGYYWGQYSYTYHEMIKNPSSESKAKHQKTLLDIITESDELGLRVPPGVHAELGNLFAMDDRMDEALNEFDKEKKLYPESKVFIERLLTSLSKGGE